MVNYTVADTQSYYEQMGPFYYRFWGSHLHWGLFKNGDELDQAAESATRYFISKLPVRAGDVVCDLACGAGGATSYLRREIGCDCVAVDISPAQLHLAQKHFRETDVGGGIFLVRSDAHRLPLADDYFDATCCFSSFYHFHDKNRVAAEVARTLKRGGYFFFDDLVETGVLAPEERREIFERQYISGLETPTGYRRLLAARGFEVLEQEDLTRHFIRTYETALEHLARHASSGKYLPEEHRRKLSRGFQRLLCASREGRVGWHAFWCRKR